MHSIDGGATVCNGFSFRFENACSSGCATCCLGSTNWLMNQWRQSLHLDSLNLRGGFKGWKALKRIGTPYLYTCACKTECSGQNQVELFKMAGSTSPLIWIQDSKFSSLSNDESVSSFWQRHVTTSSTGETNWRTCTCLSSHAFALFMKSWHGPWLIDQPIWTHILMCKSARSAGDSLIYTQFDSWICYLVPLYNIISARQPQSAWNGCSRLCLINKAALMNLTWLELHIWNLWQEFPSLLAWNWLCCKTGEMILLEKWGTSPSSPLKNEGDYNS